MKEYSELNHGKAFKLIDGGRVENLATLPLIRRGINNIIVVDSSADPNYKFVEYHDLKKMLKKLHIDLYVEGIDKFSGSKKDPFTGASVNVGTASTCKSPGGVSTDKVRVESKIFYIKLARPASILPYGQTDDRYKTGETVAVKRDEKICLNCPCPCADVLPSTETGKLLFYLVNKFDADREARRRKLWRFPQIPTWDQSLEPETMEALIALGYLEGIEINSSQPVAQQCG